MPTVIQGRPLAGQAKRPARRSGQG